MVQGWGRERPEEEKHENRDWVVADAVERGCTERLEIGNRKRGKY